MNAAFVNDKINCRSLLSGSYRLIPTPEMETKIDTNKIRKGGEKEKNRNKRKNKKRNSVTDT